MRGTGKARSRLRVVAALVPALVLALTVVGCTTPEPTPDPTSAAPAPSDSASPTPSAPTLIEGGTAEQNLPYFDYVLRAFLDESKKRSGGSFVDALVDAGFDRDDIELTPDHTAIGADADSVYFAVRLGDTCLLGQWGNGMGYRSATGEVLASGACLVGTAHPA